MIQHDDVGSKDADYSDCKGLDSVLIILENSEKRLRELSVKPSNCSCHLGGKSVWQMLILD